LSHNTTYTPSYISLLEDNQVTKEIKVEDSESMSAFGKFMRTEQIYEIEVKFEGPDGTTFTIPVVYTPATAFQIAKVYEDAKKDMETEETFDYMADLFNITIRNWRFVNVPAGKANYEEGELSVRDLTAEARNMLERAVAPGVGKTAEQLEQDIKANRRKVGKGNRRKPKAINEPAD